MIRDSITYKGISDYIPSDINSFTQMNIDKILQIDPSSPCIDEILKVSVGSEITDKKLIKTAIGRSLEGQNLTGFKLLSEGEFNLRIDFCCDDNGAIYTLNDTIFFNNATTLPESCSENCRIIENVYIEDIYAEKITNRELLININFIFTTENY